ncbi:TSUP family transporter [candidate division KSB3 bacterium]|uniref:Probable membrane transporter protein n=1 Tax=candidate division KSB3 bacterium TaxID=2044937 RepID=A0A9D5Q544_9BACT|nr:TSUP family transporter [candidate division KSB3 bacterium]MBD3323938.1 TSUP family transporter [candidate division KSB3 bacterium]
MEYLKLLLLFGVGTMAGFINVMAGGGSSLTLPALIFVGLDGAMANGTNRIALTLQGIFAVLSFHKRGIHQYQRSLQLSLLTLPGAIIGALLAVNISDAWFQRILSIVLIGIVISMFFPSKKQAQQTTAEGRRTWMIYPVMFGIGLYGGFIQVGVGFMFMAALYHILKLDLVYVNMHKVFIILVYMIPTLCVFLVTGNLNWPLGLCLAAGNSLGGWWGAHFAVKGGERVIRYVLAVAILIMAAKLLGLF